MSVGAPGHLTQRLLLHIWQMPGNASDSRVALHYTLLSTTLVLEPVHKIGFWSSPKSCRRCKCVQLLHWHLLWVELLLVHVQVKAPSCMTLCEHKGLVGMCMVPQRCSAWHDIQGHTTGCVAVNKDGTAGTDRYVSAGWCRQTGIHDLWDKEQRMPSSLVGHLQDICVEPALLHGIYAGAHTKVARLQQDLTFSQVVWLLGLLNCSSHTPTKYP